MSVIDLENCHFICDSSVHWRDKKWKEITPCSVHSNTYSIACVLSRAVTCGRPGGLVDIITIYPRARTKAKDRGLCEQADRMY